MSTDDQAGDQGAETRGGGAEAGGGAAEPYGGAPRRPEYRIDDLARHAGMSVRNVRAYQDRGLLPPPRREGRIALYSESHLARLRVIGALLERGYTLANIAELVGAWQSGQDVGDLLGLETVLAGRWAERPTVVVDAAELAERFGAGAADLVEAAIDAGILEPCPPEEIDGARGADGEGDGAGGATVRFRVPNPAAIDVGELLAGAGVPLDEVLGAARRMREHVGAVACDFVALVEDHVFDALGDRIPPAEVGRLADLVRRLRPLATQVVETELARAMEDEIGRRLGEHLERMGRPAPATAGEARTQRR